MALDRRQRLPAFAIDVRELGVIDAPKVLRREIGPGAQADARLVVQQRDARIRIYSRCRRVNAEHLLVKRESRLDVLGRVNEVAQR